MSVCESECFVCLIESEFVSCVCVSPCGFESVFVCCVLCLCECVVGVRLFVGVLTCACVRVFVCLSESEYISNQTAGSLNHSVAH